MGTRRALHFVFKVSDRHATINFFKDVLEMKVLRHEEFMEGCKATCNGPYYGKWSKTMIGYGPEDNHFVIELTYNYGINSYKLGNDFQGITIKSEKAISNAKRLNWPMEIKNDAHVIESPDGYKFILLNETSAIDVDPVTKVSLSSTDVQRSVDFWANLCGMKIYKQTDESASMGFADNQCKLEICKINEAVDHAKAFGRIAFSCPEAQLADIEKNIKEANQKILTPLVSLDTPGKATVQVVIVADPDDHEICFVGDEAFRQLSQVDVNANDLLTKAMEADKSKEWFSKKGLSKAEA